jgi:hypothetical protein
MWFVREIESEVERHGKVSCEVLMVCIAVECWRGMGMLSQACFSVCNTNPQQVEGPA